MRTTVGIRELKDRLSDYIRRAEAGETVLITVHGRAAACLGPATGNEGGPRIIHWPEIHLPSGTAAQLVDEDRDER